MRAIDAATVKANWINGEDLSISAVISDLLKSEIVLADNLIEPFARLYTSLKCSDGSIPNQRMADMVPRAIPQFSNLFIEGPPIPLPESDFSVDALIEKHGGYAREGQCLYSVRLSDSRGWLIRCNSLCAFANNRVMAICSSAVQVDEDGSIIGRAWVPGDNDTWEKAEELDTAGVARLLFSLFVVSFMNCSNVAKVEQQLSRNERRAQKARTGREPITHKVLAVRPIKKNSRENYDHHQDSSVPLHVCRGHFKTFTKEKPLFGELCGTYWWESHVRGKQEHGVIVKDYKPTLCGGS